MGMIKEFREFALKGNMIDMAVGIIIGAAFGSVVSSLVGDLITPLLGVLTNGINFGHLSYELKGATEAGGQPLLLTYGNFLQAVIDFIIKAFAIFMVVKAINTAKKRFEKEQIAAGPAAAPADVQLLTEIRDLLRQRAS